MTVENSPGYKWLALITVSIGSFMFTLDTTICSISFPRLTAVFETEPSVVLWVTVAYLLVSTALLLIVGRLGDLFGRKRIYVLGFAIFTLGLVLCSLSQTITQLILSRIVQGIGGGMIMSVIIAIVTGTFPGDERGKALGILEAIISAGVLAGPVLGGLLLDTLGWRSIFYTRAPIGLIGIIMGLVVLREQKAAATKPAVDFWGAVTLFGGLSCLLLLVNLGESLGFTSPQALALAGFGVVLLALFFFIENRISHPVVDLNLFRNRLFAGGNVSFGIMAFSLAALIFLTPFYLMDGAGYSAFEAGLFVAVSPVISLIVGPVAGWMSDRIGTVILRPAGIGLITLSLLMFSRLGADSSPLDIILGFVVFGVGIGTFNPTTENSIMGTVPRDRLGTAAAMMNTIRQIGTSTGTAVAGVLFVSRQALHVAEMVSSNLDTALMQQLSVVGGYQDVLLFAAIVCSLGVVSSLVRAAGRPKQRPSARLNDDLA